MIRSRSLMTAVAGVLLAGPALADLIFLCSSENNLHGESTLQELEGCTTVEKFSEVRYRSDRGAEARTWRVSFPATGNLPNWRAYAITQTQIGSIQIRHGQQGRRDFGGFVEFLSYRLLGATVVAVSSAIEDGRWIDQVDFSAPRVERRYRRLWDGQPSGEPIITCWDLRNGVITQGSCP